MLSSPHHQAQHANLFRERRWPCDDSAFQPFHSIAARTPPAHTAGATNNLNSLPELQRTLLPLMITRAIPMLPLL